MKKITNIISLIVLILLGLLGVILKQCKWDLIVFIIGAILIAVYSYMIKRKYKKEEEEDKTD